MRPRSSSGTPSATRSTRSSPATRRVIFFGEDVAVAGGVFAATPGLHEKYGPERVFDTPISELAMTGAAFGAAVTGKRPVLEIMFGDFLALSMDSLINQATKYWFLTGERQSCPLVIRSVVGGGAPLRRDPLADADLVADRHPRPEDRRALDAGRREGPAQGRDPRRQPGDLLRAQAALLAEAARSNGDEPEPLGKATVVREGDDVTLVSAMKGVHDCLAAADQLAEQGVSAEVIDLRTLRPIDLETIIALGPEDEPDRGRRGGAADGRLGRRGARARHRGGRSATSTTRGASRPRTRRSRTARRSRTRSSRGRSGSRPRSAGDYARSLAYVSPLPAPRSRPTPPQLERSRAISSGPW